MQHTHDFRVITAVFNSPVSYDRELAESFYPGSGHYDSGFRIGPFEYTITLNELEGQQGVYEVKFMLTDILARSDQELVEIVSRMQGKPISLNRAKYFRNHIDQFGVPKTETSYAVLSHVIATLREFIDRYRPECLVFLAWEKSRERLYRTLVHTFFKNQEISLSHSPSGAAVFNVCFSGNHSPVLEESKNQVKFTANYPQISRFAHENCGTGAGGFQPGNDCARGDPSESDLKSKDKNKSKNKNPSQKSKSRSRKPFKHSKIPSAAAITSQDLHAVKITPEILHPESDEDAKRFIAQATKTPLYQAVERKIQIIADDSPGGNPTLWSVGKNARGDIKKTLQAHGHEAYEHIEWTEERRKLHEQILSKILNPKAKTRSGEKPKVVLLMGPPGAGKTMAGQPEAAKLGVEFTVVNADDIKGMIPEYEGWNAAAVHEESALLAEGPLTQRARAERHNVLMDMTGGNTAKMEAMAEAMHRDGYEVHVISIALPAYKSTGRAWDRFVKNAFGHADPTGEKMELGRFVPLPYVHGGIDGKPEKTYHALKQKPYVKSYVAISTDVPRGESPRVVDRGSR
jgi:hypothetical protein